MTERPNDEQWLVARAQADPRAFAVLYERYVDAVFRYCVLRLGNNDDAADATSQVFAQTLAALPRYRAGTSAGAPAGSFRSWLFAIAHNVVVDAVRRRRPIASLEAARDFADTTPAPDDQVVVDEERRTLLALLGQLPEAQRRVVELRLAGLTGQEIADALGNTLVAVKSTQFRAYARLRRLLACEAAPRPKEGADGVR